MSLTITEHSVLHDTFTIERRLPVSPGRVFAAFSDSRKKQRWLAAEELAMEFRVGGLERARSVIPSGPMQGVELTTESVYQDIAENERIVMASAMNVGGRRISVTLLTFEFVPEGERTTLLFTHQAVFLPGADGPNMRREGWEKLLDRVVAEVAE